MMSFATLALASGMFQGQSTVNITPLGGSPFVLRDKKIDMFLQAGIPVSFEDASESPFIQADLRKEFPQRNAIKSETGEKFELVIQPSRILTNSFYNEVKEHLRMSVVHATVYQDSPTHFIACTPDGNRLDESQVNIPPTLFQSMKVGEVAILIEEPRYKEKTGTFWFGGNLINERREGDSHFGWFNLGPKVSAYQDVRFKFSRSELIGEMSKDVGSTSTFGGTTFSVTERHVADPMAQNWIDISVSEMVHPIRFYFFRNLDVKKLLKELGPSFSFELSESGEYSRKKPDNHWSYRLTSDVPFEYWDKIRVIKETSISCYLRHIATEPINP
jgi:hypothetical protein